MAATNFSAVSRTGARRSLGETWLFEVTAPGRFAACEMAFPPLLVSTAMARIRPKPIQLKRRARFIVGPVYLFGFQQTSCVSVLMSPLLRNEKAAPEFYSFASTE